MQNLIRTKFKGHRLAKLVKAIMEAKGYTTHMGSSDESGSDLDILLQRVEWVLIMIQEYVFK